MSGISSKAAGAKENKYKYYGIELEKQEFSDGSGLEEYAAHFRDLDPQTGRWWQIDPEAEKDRESLSPYNSMSDDPILRSDPLGDEDGFWQELKNAVKETAVSAYEGTVQAVRTFNTYVNPITPIAELVVGKSVESDFTQDKPRMTSLGEGVMMVVVPGGKIEGKIAEKALISGEEKAIEGTGAKKIGSLTGHTDHGLNQSISRDGGRGVNIAAKLDALKNPKKLVAQTEGRIKYVGKKANVILNSEGQVITVTGKNRGPVQQVIGKGNAAKRRIKGLNGSN